MAKKILSPALRNTGAVLAGLLTVVISSTATDAFMHGSGVFPPMGQAMSTELWVLATTYRFVFSALGGWLTARLALEPKMRSVTILAGVGLALGTLGAAATWGKGPEFGPQWYPVAVALTGPLATWLGGLFHEKRSSN